MDKLLEYNSISISFEGEETVRDVSFSLNKGEILGVVGESGSGKSTIIKSIMGILSNQGEITEGEIIFDGKNLTQIKEKEYRKIRGPEIGMIFQDASAYLSPIRTIGDQIVESMRAHGKVKKSYIKECAIEMFGTLNLRDPEKIWSSYPFELSGGMNQRVSIAMAMLMKPRLLLADEPTSALDNISRNQIIEELLRLRELYNTAIILVTHDIEIVSTIADKALVIKDGAIMDYGNAKQVLDTPTSDYTIRLLNDMHSLRGQKYTLGQD
ncbi:MAG: ABC transporter ATP-binding protein [Pseudobutyrivibrio sp.]|nr:ABC transporter ATP-binding protein [Pseudobutyrivibrio sp.]